MKLKVVICSNQNAVFRRPQPIAMSEHETYIPPGQQSLFDGNDRALLDQLISDSSLYKSSTDYKELLAFVVRLRQFAPFNAMLLQVQKPGLNYAASKHDWQKKFGRKPVEGARPLLIMWPFGPVALVYDVVDTEGRALPEDVSAYIATGNMEKTQFDDFTKQLAKSKIQTKWVDNGDAKAGLVRRLNQSQDEKKFSEYEICINRNHTYAVQFVTLAHELGHLFLGHLGPDKKLNIPTRQKIIHKIREIEAESVAYIVCERNGVQSKSHTYLSHYVNEDTTLEDIDVYQIMRAAGQVETLLKLATRTNFK